MAPRVRETKRGKKPAYHHRALREALIAAALELVAERGPTGFSLREVTRRVGVTHAAPYRHFADRAALLAAVAGEGFLALRKAMIAARSRASSRGPLARLEALGHGYVRFAVGHPSHFRAMFSSEAARAGGSALESARDATFSLLVAEIEAGQKRGLLRAAPAIELALPAWAIVHGLAALSVDRVARVRSSKGSVDRVARLITRALLDGLGSEAGRRG